jgi:hypothetical protein
MRIIGQLSLAAALSVLLFVFGCQLMRGGATVEIPAAETPRVEVRAR